MLQYFLLDFILLYLLQNESQGDTMAETESEKKAKRERDKLKQETVRKHVKSMRDLEASLDDKDIATIHIKHGLFAIVDRDLFTTLNSKNWHVNIQPEHIHARSSFGQTIGGKQRFRTLQSAVVQVDLLRQGIEKVPKQVSFKNKLTLDCRVSNLIYKNQRKGAMRNRTAKRDTTSAFKGVLQRATEKARGVWSAQIFDKNLGCIYLDSHPTEIEAAAAYVAASLILFGEDGHRNLSLSDITPEMHKLAAVKIEGKKIRDAAREKQKHFITKALEEGKTALEIRRVLNISQATYARILKKIEN